MLTGGAQLLQWRGFDLGEQPDDEAAEQFWKDPKRPINRAVIISKKGLLTTKQCAGAPA